MHRVFLTPSESEGLQKWLHAHHPKAEFAIRRDETPISNVSLTRFVRCPAVFKWPLPEDEDAFPIIFGGVFKKWLLEQWAGHVAEPKIQAFLKSKDKTAVVKLWVLRKDKKVLEDLRKDFAALLPNMPSVGGKLKLSDNLEAILTFVPNTRSAHLQKVEALLKRPHEYHVFFRRNQKKGDHDMVLMRTELDADLYEYALGEVLAELEKQRSQETSVDDKEFDNILRRVNSEDLDEFSGTLRGVPTNLTTPTKRIRWFCKKKEGLSKFIEFLKKKEAQLQKKTAEDLPKRTSSKKAPRETEDERVPPPQEASIAPDWNIGVLRKVFCEEQGVSAESREQERIHEVPKVAKGAKKTPLRSKGVTKDKKGSEGESKAAMKDANRNIGDSSGFAPHALGDKEETEMQKFAGDRPPPSLREICRDDDALTKHVQDVFRILRYNDDNVDLSPPGEERLQEEKARSLRDEFKHLSGDHVKNVVDRYDVFRVLSPPELKNLHLKTRQNLDADLGLLDSTQLYNMLVKMNRDEDDYWERWMPDMLVASADGRQIAANLTRLLTSMSEDAERENIKKYAERLLKDDGLHRFLAARYMDVGALTPGDLLEYLQDMQEDPIILREFAVALKSALGFHENDIPGEAMEESIQRQTSPSFPLGEAFQTPLPEPNESLTPPAGFSGTERASSGGGLPDPSESSKAPPWDDDVRPPPLPPSQRRSPPPMLPASRSDISPSSHLANAAPEDDLEDFHEIINSYYQDDPTFS